MSFCDFEGPSFAVSSWPVARKEYKCCECGNTILKGEKHAVTSGKWDGRMETFRQHLECEEACRFYRDVLDGECLAFGELWECDFLNEYMVPGKEKEDDKRFRTVFAKAKWRKEKNRPLFLTKNKPVCNSHLLHDRTERKYV